ncbi:GNAT family N-acetyltransferase [Williamwhitmania taraxaci]|uniref:Diamine N-acetyltransferase n=1 Tax=Williamwhitmania taraxaci TaxID=1640674 RepID=A0A1G6GSD5_9BACT|nr:GNAT family protein [Williamwhitmania taraxaci]SDB84839.1 diamine N-acetyltransferase [Williamwhitmania taraxaci]
MDNLLQSAHIRLRAIEPSDIELLYSWENNMKIWAVSNTLTPFSKYLLKKYIESAHIDIYEAKQLRLIIEAKDQSSFMFHPVGAIDLFDFDPFHSRAGIGILIHNEEERNKGYASESIRLLTKYAFETLQLHQLYCNVAATNTASLQIFQKMGFKIVGIKEQWLKTQNGWMDELMLQMVNPLSLNSIN